MKTRKPKTNARAELDRTWEQACTEAREMRDQRQRAMAAMRGLAPARAFSPAPPVTPADRHGFEPFEYTERS